MSKKKKHPKTSAGQTVEKMDEAAEAAAREFTAKELLGGEEAAEETDAVREAAAGDTAADLPNEDEAEEETNEGAKKEKEKKKEKKKKQKRARATVKFAFGRKARFDEKKIEEELTEIYGNGDGTMPDMKNFEKKKRNRLVTAFVTLLISLAALGAIAWAGFFVFQPQSRFSEEDVVLSVSGDEEITSGQDVQYRIRYRNAQNVPLAKVVLQVRYPEGFVLTEASPEPTNDNRDEWVLGSIEEHGSGYIDIIGKLYGDLGKKQSFRAFLNYVPSNFSAEFQKVASVAAEVTQSPVSLTVLGPEEVAAGAEAEFTLLVAKQGDAPAEELAVVFDPGDLFTLKESEPDSDNDNKYRWSVPELADEMKIVLRGSFAEGAPDGANVAFSVLGWKDESRTFDGYVLQKVARSVKIAQTDVSASLAINGTLTDFSVQPGEALHASIAIANNGDDAIENVSVTVVFDTPSYDNKSMLDWTKLEDEADGAISGEQRSADTRRGGILWNKNKVSALARIEPGSDATIDFTIPLKSAEGIDLAGFTTHEIIAVVDLQYSKGGEQKTLSGNPITMTVNSDATLGVQDELSAADDGKEQHRITWIVNNTFHELKDISLEADFYGDIQLADDAMVVPAGTAAFDKDAGRLLWSVESMPTSVDVLAFQFDAVLNSKNPSQTNLASKVRFKATDVITGQEIILAGDEILLNAE